MSLWTALLLGVLGGWHCAGMCGPLMLIVPAAGRSGAGVPWVSGRVLYQIGRVATYGGLGILAGGVGRVSAFAGIQGWVSIGLGVLLLVGLWGARWPGTAVVLSLWVGRLKGTMARYFHQRSFTALVVLGALNGLLPCGLVYAALAVAATTGSGRDGLLYMIVFGGGTFPIMLGISLTGRLMPAWVRGRLRHLTATGVALAGFLLILRGMSLDIPYLSPVLSPAGGTCCIKTERTLEHLDP